MFYSRDKIRHRGTAALPLEKGSLIKLRLVNALRDRREVSYQAIVFVVEFHAEIVWRVGAIEVEHMRSKFIQRPGLEEKNAVIVKPVQGADDNLCVEV